MDFPHENLTTCAVLADGALRFPRRGLAGNFAHGWRSILPTRIPRRARVRSRGPRQGGMTSPARGTHSVLQLFLFRSRTHPLMCRRKIGQRPTSRSRLRVCFALSCNVLHGDSLVHVRAGQNLRCSDSTLRSEHADSARIFAWLEVFSCQNPTSASNSNVRRRSFKNRSFARASVAPNTRLPNKRPSPPLVERCA